MKISDSLAGIISKSVIANVLDGSTQIDLNAVSTDDTTARGKYGTSTFPTIDSNLVAIQTGNLYSKTATNDLTFPRDQALQVARSISVDKGLLEPALEYDETIDFSDPRVSNLADVHDVFSIGSFHFFVDVELNDGTVLQATTSSRDVTIQDGYYGNLETTETLYEADGLILEIGSENQTTENRIDDGSTTGGLYLVDTMPGLIAAAQSRALINANVLLRVAILRDAKVLFGPIRVNKLKVDSTKHIVNVDDKRGLIQLGLSKSWDAILNSFGMKATHADHLSRFPNDNFLRYTYQVQSTFTWKS